MEVLKWIMFAVIAGVLSVVAAVFFGWIAGLFQATKESTFRLRALQLFGTRGKTDEFLIVSGDPELVKEVYRVVVATTARVEDARDRAANNTDGGIGIDETEQNTDRSA
jgi:hypothetical protein